DIGAQFQLNTVARQIFLITLGHHVKGALRTARRDDDFALRPGIEMGDDAPQQNSQQDCSSTGGKKKVAHSVPHRLQTCSCFYVVAFDMCSDGRQECRARWRECGNSPKEVGMCPPSHPLRSLLKRRRGEGSV